MKVFLIVFVAIAVGSSQVSAKYPIQAFLGSLCPDSLRFIQNQVVPVYNEFKNYLDFTFVPFGKAYSIGDPWGEISFVCQHGPDDCHLSRVQLCAMSYMKDEPDRVMEYVACQMNFGADRTGQTCVERVNLSFEEVMKCYDNTLGTTLQRQAEAMTNNIQNPLAWVPTTSYNWVFDQEFSQTSEFNLRGTLCAAFNFPGC